MAVPTQRSFSLVWRGAIRYTLSIRSPWDHVFINWSVLHSRTVVGDPGEGPWGFGQILLLGVVRKCRGVPFLCFIAIFMLQFFGPYPLPPGGFRGSPPPCVHLWYLTRSRVAVAIFAFFQSTTLTPSPTWHRSLANKMLFSQSSPWITVVSWSGPDRQSPPRSPARSIDLSFSNCKVSDERGVEIWGKARTRFVEFDWMGLKCGKKQRQFVAVCHRSFKIFFNCC